jgi:hypothetical protein
MIVSEQQRARVFLAIPTYLSRIECADVIPALMRPSKNHEVGFGETSTSANCLGFNKLWIQALELRETQGFTHFLMLHSDIVVQPYFIDQMMDIMNRTGADVLSAIVPIKDEKGVTSTAIDEPINDLDVRWRMRRLTMREVHKMPETFTHPKLLINTGCMLVDLRKDWVEKIYFHFDDEIIMHQGKRIAVCQPEDWGFSRDARKLGAKLWATREVKVKHAGQQMYPNDVAWGEWETDATTTSRGVPSGLLDTMERIPGWFSAVEGAQLYKTAMEALKVSDTILEVGSFKGRSTSVLARACKDTGEGRKVYAVDPHMGDVNLPQNIGESFTEFTANMKALGFQNIVAPIRQRSEDTTIDFPLGMLFIDGLHDYEHVKIDWQKFGPFVRDGGFVCFHDYEPNYPGVIKLADELIASGKLKRVTLVGSLLVCQV